MIQIDDAGSGSFVGGTCIGIYRPEKNEYYFDIIPVKMYNLENFEKKLYLGDVVRIVKTAFSIFDIPKSEIIEICRGYMFEELKNWLNMNNYCWYSTHITGRFQNIVEKNFTLYAVKLGLPLHYIKFTKYPFHFHKLLRWVFSDFENRINLCKVGWKSWQKIKGIKPDIYEGKMENDNYICLKCGEQIKSGSRIKILKYVSNRENYVYLHPEC